jgi:PKD repeat protein
LKRRLQFESLDPRLTFNIEGQTYTLNPTLETAALGGAISGSVFWGDGSSTPVQVVSGPATGPLSIRFDYSLDSNNFFASQERRDTLQLVANSIVSKFSDQLLAIRPAGTDQWTARFLHPGTGAQTTLSNLVIEGNQILIFAGGRNFSGGELARGEKGGFSATSSSQTFIDTVKARGQTGALAATPTDFGPWGGSVSFSLGANWHFGATTAGLDPGESDFASVASHELMHTLGFGLAASWTSKVAGGFTGANAAAVYGQSPVPLNDANHWAASLVSDGRPAVMTPNSPAGVRRLPTRLDYAAMQDIGWQVLPTFAQITASNVYGDNGTYPASIVLQGSTFGATTYPLAINIANASPQFLPQAGIQAIQGQPLSIPRIGQFIDAGFGSPGATPPRLESFAFVIDWGDSTAPSTGSATIEAIGSPGAPTRGYFDGLHTYSQAGVYTVTMTVTDDDGGSSQQQFAVTVGPPPRLEISLDRASISEAAGNNAAQLTVQLIGSSNATGTTVLLQNRDSSELQLPASVFIPASQTSALVPVNAVDDTLLDGTVRVTLLATTDNLTSNEIFLDVTDEERIFLSLAPTSVSENAGSGASILTVTRSNTDLGLSVDIQLQSSDTSEAQVPTLATIPPGQTSIAVGVNAIDDALFDGTQLVVISGNANGYLVAPVSLSVTDYQPISFASQSTELNEDDATANTTIATLSIRSPAPPEGLTLQLAASVANQLSFPASVVIPPGSQSVSFPVTAIDNFLPESRRTIRLIASAAGVGSNSIDFTVFDADIAYWTNTVNRLDVNNNGTVDPLDVLNIINEINLRGIRTLNPNLDRDLPFVDTNANGQIDPLDALEVINELNRE